MKVTPYDTGKIKIGCNYAPPAKPWIPSRTENMLQSALLDGKPALDWDGITIIVSCAFLVAVLYLLMAWRAS
jgi:hypothetical protein